ncbi:hypothetical protein JZM24_15070 [Candidatus Sodalis endolongispinus]|uniref:Multidrug resistance protein NorM n=1 Tax=Candidatus Sodalis endolongispinus TaxID=2812662 RepID=A0ABS5YEF1_9GAMM|nr:hypothetical protein [Candidatus Sodalis endolongispinus]
MAFFTGRLQPRHCRRAGNRALALGAVVMLCAAATLALFGQHILRVFIAPTDRQFAAIDALTARLFAILACHMVFDGMQTIAAGALRGLKDTRYPLVICLAGYWGIACPCALVLAFGLSWGAVGLWSGYALGLAVVAGLLLLRWRTLIGRRLKMRPIPAALPPCA